MAPHPRKTHADWGDLMMSLSISNVSLAVAALGSGLVAGTFFAFSVFIMTALARLPPEYGIAAMQSINTTILRSLFMLFFLLTALLSVVIAVIAIRHWDISVSPAMLAGAGLYLVTVFLSTIVFNVPLNDALAKVDGNSGEAARIWQAYVVDWTRWNHLRTVAAVLSTIAFLRALA